MADSRKTLLRHFRNNSTLGNDDLKVNVAAIAKVINPNRREKVQFMVQIKAINDEERARNMLAIGLKNLRARNSCRTKVSSLALFVKFISIKPGGKWKFENESHTTEIN